MMLRAIYISLLLSLPFWGMSQQDYLNSQYMFSLFNINPAYTGSKDVLAASLSHRSQWVGFDGAPSTQVLSLHAPITKLKIGVGAQIYHDVIGPREISGINTSYAYHIKLGKGKLGFGLRAGLINYSYNWSDLNYRETTDLVIGQGKTNGMKLNFDFGAYFKDRLQFAGIEIAHLSDPDISSSTVQMDYVPHLSAFYGRAFEINKKFVLKPSVLFRASQGSYITDINFSALINKKVWAGVSYRTSGFIIFMVDYFITQKLRLGYSYDYGINGLSTYQSGSHEIFLGFDFQIFKTEMLSPRYF